jgi:hypothetical protein
VGYGVDKRFPRIEHPYCRRNQGAKNHSSSRNFPAEERLFLTAQIRHSPRAVKAIVVEAMGATPIPRRIHVNKLTKYSVRRREGSCGWTTALIAQYFAPEFRQLDAA